MRPIDLRPWRPYCYVNDYGYAVPEMPPNLLTHVVLPARTLIVLAMRPTTPQDIADQLRINRPL